MDNNFVNIDDLFRQRLGGGEEQEREGAWMRMRELLDTEERRRPVGFYWRRAFTYLGVLLLLATLSFGGYELNSYRNLGAANGGNNGTDGTLASTGTEGSRNNNSAADGASATDANGKKARIDAGAHEGIKRSAVTTGTLSSGNNETSITNTSNSSNEQITTSNTPSQEQATASKGNHARKAINTKGTNADVAATANTKTTAKQAAVKATADTQNATAVKHDRKHTAGKVTDQAATTGKGMSDMTAFAGTTSDAAARDNRRMDKVSGGKLARNTATVNAGNNAAATSDLQAPVVSATKTIKPIKHTHIEKTVANTGNASGKALASAGSNTNGSHIKAVKEVKDAAAQQANDKKIASAATVKKGGNPAKIKRATDEKAVATATVKKGGIVAAKTGSGKTGKQSGKGTSTANPGDNSTDGVATVAAPQVQKRSVQKIVIVQHLRGSSLDDIRQMQLDTISIDNEMEDVVASAEKATGKPSVMRNILPAAAPKAEPAVAAKSNVNTVASLTPASNGTIEGLKNNTANKKGGMNAAQKLSSMFNDVKYKVQGIQFAPGLTAGINGTFFGPNNFRGFQFGLTGTFIIDEDWSVMAEVKYFNRMNNNFSISDNYVDYVKKDSVVNTYSFSTLHSFEVPLSIRYCFGRFNLYGGGNFVYALGINTGSDPVYTNLVNTPAPGQKSAPGLTIDDFASRMAFGYLLGMTMEISPNVTLDFRTTQNLWDNMHSDGGKTVSSQLYRSPSLQLSVGYRFGGGKGKN